MNILKALKEYRERSLRKKIVLMTLNENPLLDVSYLGWYCNEVVRYITTGKVFTREDNK